MMLRVKRRRWRAKNACCNPSHPNPPGYLAFEKISRVKSASPESSVTCLSIVHLSVGHFAPLKAEQFMTGDLAIKSCLTLVAVSKEVTREQAERKKEQAAEFMERLGEPDRAEEFDDMTVDEYADHRGFRLTNPKRNPRSRIMANGTTNSKAVLQDQIDRAISTLEDAYTPETNREDMAEAVGNALDILKGEDEDDDDDLTVDNDDDDDDDGSVMD
jgi:hypothetical protein